MSPGELLEEVVGVFFAAEVCVSVTESRDLGRFLAISGLDGWSGGNLGVGALLAGFELFGFGS